MALVNFSRGNKPASLAGLDANTVYFFTDTQEIYMGGKIYGVGDVSDITGDITSLETAVDAINLWRNGREAGDGQEAVEGAEDRIVALEADTHTHSNKAVLDGITANDVSAWNAAEANATAVANQKVASVTAADNSITIGGTATAPTVGVKLNASANNAIELTSTGLKVTIPEGADYTVSINELGSNDDYVQRYQIKQGPAGAQTEIGTINIPKDMVVESGSVVTLSAPDQAGHAAGTYIKLILANAASDEIWVPVDSLIEYVTSGSQQGDQIMVYVDSATHQVTATLTNGSVTYAQLASSVQSSLDLADSAMQSIANGSVTKDMLAQAVQDSIDAADSALQATDIITGTTNGTISVDGTEVAVAGLGSAAYTDSSAYATAAQGALAASALQAADITEGSTNGTIAVKNVDVAVHGLQSAAYTTAESYATSAQGTNADNAIAALTWGELA